ncbi:hypothetical protein EDD16DRAFT_1515399 [Pisolithus croceorrhizus]|nr:hypothetical protein EDD16DRAFT_1515399 [Pisolithus croceorrhizus]
MYKDFGDPDHHPPHTAALTLTQLQSIQCNFLTPEALHYWHCQFWDHDMQWCKHALGAAELDFQFSVLPPIAGFCHLNQGMTKLKQVAALKTFHDHKHAIIDAGLCHGQTSGAALDHWEIPKLEFMQSVTPSIHQAGTVIQWSANTTEHAHIEVVKDPVTTMNNQNYDSQICCTLDHDKKWDNSKTDTLNHSDLNMADSAGDDAIINILQDLWVLLPKLSLLWTPMKILAKLSPSLQQSPHLVQDCHWNLGRYDAAILNTNLQYKWLLSGLAVQQAHGLIDNATGLHVLQRAVHALGTPLGEVFPLDQIRSYTHITPHFGAAADN